MEYTEIVKSDLVDGKGDILSFIVESNGVSWKLYMTLSKEGSTIRRSRSWAFADRKGATVSHSSKVAEAVAMGWKKR